MSDQQRLTDKQLREVLYSASSGIHGTGLFASRDIEKGEYIGTFAGPQVREDGMHVLWVYEDGDEAEPVGRRGRNLLRFLNHASSFNAEFDGFDLYARRAIGRDVEITIDYGGEL